MKRIILILVFLSNVSWGQITLSGATTFPEVNLTYIPVSSMPTTDCYITYNDAGTNIYKASVQVPATGFYPAHRIDYYISRRNNYWHIESFNYLIAPHTYKVHYVSSEPISDINPPCSTISWKIYSGSCIPLGGFTIADTGNTTSNLTLSGTCASLPIKSSASTPQYVQLPQLSTPQIINLASPQKGMMVFDVNRNEVKVYNGAGWQTLSYVGHVTLLR